MVPETNVSKCFKCLIIKKEKEANEKNEKISLNFSDECFWSFISVFFYLHNPPGALFGNEPAVYLDSLRRSDTFFRFGSFNLGEFPSPFKDECSVKLSRCLVCAGRTRLSQRGFWV